MNTIFNNISYYPYLKGKYDVSPAFHKLELLNQTTNPDNYIFQIDNNYDYYISNKNECRKEDIHKYYQGLDISDKTLKSVNSFIIKQLCNEYHLFFECSDNELLNKLTDEKIVFNKNFELINNKKYLSLFDALVSQVQEDIVICSLEQNNDRLSAIHLCSPSYWSAEEKIGKKFSETHLPVAGMEKIRKVYRPILESVITKGPFYRFAWEINVDNTLNHHPDKLLLEKKFNPENPELFVRVERQCVLGIDLNTILFTIKTYYKNVMDLNKEQIHFLNKSLNSMSLETLKYKRIENSINHISQWLNEIEKAL